MHSTLIIVLDIIFVLQLTYLKHITLIKVSVLAVVLTKPSALYDRLCKQTWSTQPGGMTSAYLELSQNNLVLASTDFWPNWRAFGSPEHQLLYKVRGLFFRRRDPVESLACAMCLVVADEVDHAKPNLSIINPHRPLRCADSRRELSVEWPDIHICATRCRARSLSLYNVISNSQTKKIKPSTLSIFT